MKDALLNFLWPRAQDLALLCPPSPTGVQPDPEGLFDPAVLGNAYRFTNFVMLGVVLGTVLVCYLLTRTTLGPAFKLRWTVLGAIAVALAAASSLVLRLMNTVAMVESCANNPDAFPVAIPWEIVRGRAMHGAIWGLLAFAVFSLILTQTVGRWPWGRGFFHNRGWPASAFRRVSE